MNDLYDLVVIGGGAGGLGVASAAARVGAKVALIEKGKLGGECTHTACVPSKALLKAARVAHQARTSARFGIWTGEVTVDFPVMMARVRETVASFYENHTEERFRARGIEIVFGSPEFESYDAVVVDRKTRLASSRFVIATGSRPDVPAIPGLRETGFLTNQTIWELNERPESLAILGAGPVGLELGQAFARLGTKVTILDSNPEIVNQEDPDATAILRKRLAAEGITFFTNVEVTGVGPKEGKTLVKFRSNRDGSSFEALRSHLLVCTGRLANVEGMNLQAAGIHATAERGITVDDYLATESRHIYAIGDVTGRDRYTHAAEREAEVVFQNAVLKRSKKFRDDAMPRTIFTDPEFAAVGMTEAQAREHDPDGRVFTLDLAKVDRVRIDGDAGGLAKVYATAAGKVLGATIIGPEASLVLQEFVLAIEHGLTLADLAATVHPYPTAISAVHSMANQFARTRMETGFVKTAMRWFYGFEPEKTSREPASR